ncbi:MAG TPA: FecR domain-containing protein [Anaerohalosphaeraceae bacterium]|nr:FecR domain-containing protein [Anaerohalosphaeraceae bacterium]HOL87997.1 FecR domain-containing protein [Anaerohalosphaeraceae bacterium]HPP55496.1 FecR domain-containing protein [Anaerohalosphaeraceae bacterium]
MNKKEPQFVEQLTGLFVLSLEGTISPEQFEVLTNLLKTNKAAREYYYDFIASYVGMNHLGILSERTSAEDSWPNPQLWNELLSFERSAPALEIPSCPPLVEEAEKPRRGPHASRVNKVSLVSLLVSAAALVFVIAYGFLTSLGRGVEVATLSDSINAKWADRVSPVEKGTRLATGDDQWLLREGYAELMFDNQAKVVLEGPAEFQILASDRIGLQYGKVYVRAPGEAAGFSIYTPDAKIIDLGTEFGVQADIGGSTQVHVLKGKTMLLAGRSGRVNLEISQGHAKKIAGRTGEVSDIECQSDYFVRAINSKSKWVWRGQNLCLADIAGGGNGLGTGLHGSCIDTTTGRWKADSYLPTDSTTIRPGTHMVSDHQYHPVRDNPFIDGVFIPDGEFGPVQVTSRGHLFRDFPDTSSLGWGGIIYPDQTLLTRPIRLNKVQYGIPGKGALFMHGNAGITFDLEKIRAAYPGMIREFRAVYGIADEYLDGGGCPAYADFWVLVDGQVRFVRKGVQVRQGGTISVPLSNQDRFLTLVTTDGGKGSPEYDNRTSFNDWSVFGEPCLVFE